MSPCHEGVARAVFDAPILMIDDEATNLRLLQKMLAGSGYTRVNAVQNPEQAVELACEQTFDLLILDLNMPQMDGFQVMAQLQRSLDRQMPPVLVLTAQQAREFRIRALENGASDYLTKPFDRTELLARVRNLIEVRLAQRYMREQNSILDRKVKERTRQLYDTRLQIVQRLGRAAEYRDNETGLHIIRMSKISALLGREAGLSDYEIELLLNASPMHDVGKIGIPDQILLKPGKLNAEEWDIMKTHAQIGADLLAGDDSDLLTMAHDIALTHHEKWDGSGYPNGLEGEAIPLVGRIVALADVFDALTSERPYKRAWPVERAVELIGEESGRHFDPALAQRFLAVLPEILAIMRQHAEPESERVAV